MRSKRWRRAPFSESGNRQTSGHLTGAVMPRLTQANLNRIPIPCPDIDVQRAIAKVPGALDDTIYLNRRMSRTLEAVAQWMFKSWFVDFEQDLPTAEWEARRLDGVADCLYGLTLQKDPLIERQESLSVIKVARLRALHGDARGASGKRRLTGHFAADRNGVGACRLESSA